MNKQHDQGKPPLKIFEPGEPVPLLHSFATVCGIIAGYSLCAAAVVASLAVLVLACGWLKHVCFG